MLRLLDPKLDIVFKLLFADPRNEHLLCALLNAVLEPDSPITEARVLNPELPGEMAWEKGVSLDLRARLADGTHVNVEMQMAPQPAQRERALYYWARNYGSQLERGDAYTTLARAVSVVIFNYVELPWAHYHSTFHALERETQHPLSLDLEIHVLQLPLLERLGPETSSRPVVRWGRFFAARTEPQLEQLAMSDSNLREAKEALERLSLDPAAQRLASDREVALYFYKHSLEQTRIQGEALGRAEGEALGRAEGEALGRAEGEALGKARALLAVLDARKIAVSAEQRARIESCSNGSQLERWIRNAVCVNTASELFE